MKKFILRIGRKVIKTLLSELVTEIKEVAGNNLILNRAIDETFKLFCLKHEIE